MNNKEQKELFLARLKGDDARGKQKLVGPSEIGKPCDRCLTERLFGIKPPQGQYWLGAVIGTAIHATLEETALAHGAISQSNLENRITPTFEPSDTILDNLTETLVEVKVPITYIEGYGQISGKVDTVYFNQGLLEDTKTSTRTKMAKFRRDPTEISQQNYVQQHLYAYGLNNYGISIDTCSFAFVARDGGTSDHVWIHQFPYDKTIAESAIERLTNLWECARVVPTDKQKHFLESLKQDSNCYTCNRVYYR